MLTQRTCTVAGCDRKHRRNGLCDMHDQRMKRTGTTDSPVRSLEDVREIRTQHAAGRRRRDIAAEFGVTGATVNRVVSREGWRHVA